MFLQGEKMNKWRKTLERSYDGNNAFQCLACKQHCQAPDFPIKAKIYDGSLTNYGYKFCPYCGVLFEGEYDWGSENIKHFGYDIKIPERKPSIVWAIQEITVWRQPDGSFKQLAQQVSCKETQVRWEPELKWKTLSLHPNASAHQMYDCLLLQKKMYKYNNEDKDDFFPNIKNLVRVVVVKPGTPLWEEYQHYHGTWYDRMIDSRFWDEYRQKWGGKKHWNERERSWIRVTE